MRLAQVIMFEDDRYYEPQPIPGSRRLDVGISNVAKWTKEHRTIIGRFLSLHCEAWVREAQGHPTFRGTRRTNEWPSFTRRVRDDRIPLDSSPEENELFEFFLKTAGSSARRHNSLFVTGVEGYAESYGAPYAVYPMGNFSYTWLPRASDWASLTNMSWVPPTREWIVPERMAENEQFRYLTQHRMNEFPATWQVILDEQGPAELAARILRDGRRSFLKYMVTDPTIYDPEKIKRDMKVDQGLPEALKSGVEIMVRCKQALYLHPLVQHELDSLGGQQ